MVVQPLHRSSTLSVTVSNPCGSMHLPGAHELILIPNFIIIFPLFFVCLLKNDSMVVKAVDWNTQKPGGGVNDYVEIIAKDTVLLHKVLSRYLSVQITEVCSSFRTSSNISLLYPRLCAQRDTEHFHSAIRFSFDC